MISARIRPRSEALSLIIGDFNYVSSERDRFANEGMGWTGRQNLPEEESFCKAIGTPFGFCELSQEECTHSSALGRSRIDRVYCNHFLADQLDRRIGCAALEWIPGLSAHRPLTFFRRKPSRKDRGSRPLPSAPMKDPEWAHRVTSTPDDSTPYPTQGNAGGDRGTQAPLPPTQGLAA